MDAGTKAGDQVQVMSNQLSLESVAGPSLATGPSTSLGQQLLDLRRHIAKLEAILKGQVELNPKSAGEGALRDGTVDAGADTGSSETQVWVMISAAVGQCTYVRTTKRPYSTIGWQLLDFWIPSVFSS